MGEDYTTIRISEDTKDRLSEYGDVDMSYDDVVTELLDRIEDLEGQ